jgi:hypothetical protein
MGFVKRVAWERQRMPDVVRDVESRLTKLEQEVLAIKKCLATDSAQPWWRRTAGMFKGDKTFAKIVRLGRQIREAERVR